MSNVTVAELQAWARLDQAVTPAQVQSAIEAVEREINTLCRRVFTTTAANASARSYFGTGTPLIQVHDFATTSGLVVVNFGTTVSSSSYQLEPVDGLDDSGQSVPYTAIRLVDGTVWQEGTYGATSVTITAKWGWGTTLPSTYYEAVKIAAADLLSQRDLRNGIVGITDVAAVRIRQNPRVLSLLDGLMHPYRKWGVA